MRRTVSRTRTECEEVENERAGREMVQIKLAENEWRPEQLPLEWDLVTRSPQPSLAGRTLANSSWSSRVVSHVLWRCNQAELDKALKHVVSEYKGRVEEGNTATIRTRRIRCVWESDCSDLRDQPTRKVETRMCAYLAHWARVPGAVWRRARLSRRLRKSSYAIQCDTSLASNNQCIAARSAMVKAVWWTRTHN